MKLFISLDMEGIAGTFNWQQETHQDRALVRKWMTQQIEWVIEGIRQSPKNSEIKEIVIADSHDSGDNLSYDITGLDDRLHLISGTPRPDYMMPTLDESYDVVFLVGYHSGTGTIHGNMDHTYSNSTIHNIWINGKPMNETYINSAYAGRFSVPVGLVIGDKALKNQLLVEGGMPWVEYVVTKEALFKFSAKHRPMELVREDTSTAIQKVLAKNLKSLPLYTFSSPIELKIEFQTTNQADFASLLPHVKRLDGRTITYTAEDYRTIFEMCILLPALGHQG
jgi:D-amino peptidase